MSVQRINIDVWESPIGNYVTYADHVAALAEAVKENDRAWRLKWIRDTANVRAVALREAREAVAALPWEVAISFGPIDCDYSCEIGPCTCSGVMRPEGWTTGPGDALAAIDALTAQTSPQPVEASFPSGAEVPTSVAPAGEDHGAPSPHIHVQTPREAAALASMARRFRERQP